MFPVSSLPWERERAFGIFVIVAVSLALLSVLASDAFLLRLLGRGGEGQADMFDIKSVLPPSQGNEPTDKI